MNSQKAFTLLEMAVVLMIIALMIGGVMVGQSMLRTSQVNGVMVVKDKLITATTQFKEKYDALPGDMMDAQSRWGVLHPTPANCYNAAPSTGTQTCNGTGNGRIWPLGDTETATTKYESFRAWQHLANAGLIDKKFTGRDQDGNTNDASSTYVPDLNVPASGMNGGYFRIRDFGRIDGDATYFNTGYFHSLMHNDVLTSEDAYNLDKKFDDGRPAMGMIKSTKLTPSVTCTSTAVEGTAEYSRKQTDMCTLYFLMGF